MKRRVLFVCVHNSARSQMAEAFLKEEAGNRFEVESAGLEPGNLNPLAIAAMHEIGIDISANQTTSVASMIERGVKFDYVITVCDESSAERCPFFPGGAQRLHWSFRDPAALSGTAAEQMAGVREIRDAIRAKVRGWLSATAGD
jgi:arsenate reductase (thioredoxin)